MVSGGKTAECLEIAAVKVGNHTNAAVDVDWCVSQIGGQCRFVKYIPMVLNCLQVIFVCQIEHLMQPYSLSSVEIRSWTCCVNKDGGKLL